MMFSYRQDDSIFRGFGGFFDVAGGEERFLVAQAPPRQPDHGRILLVVPWAGLLH